MTTLRAFKSAKPGEIIFVLKQSGEWSRAVNWNFYRGINFLLHIDNC